MISPRRLFTASLLLVCLSSIGTTRLHANDATKREKIVDLFQLMQVEKSIDQVSAQQVAQAKSLIATMTAKQNVSAEQQQDINAFLDRVLAMTHEAINWQKLQPQFTDLYAQTYSEEEIDGILAFYRSPVGQVMAAKQPELLAKSQVITQAQLIAILPQIRQAAIQFAQQMSTKNPK